MFTIQNKDTFKFKPGGWYKRATNQKFTDQVNYVMDWFDKNSTNKHTFKHMLVMGVGLDRKNWKRDLKGVKVLNGTYKREKLEQALAIQEADLIDKSLSSGKAFDYFVKAYGAEYDQEVLKENPPTLLKLDFGDIRTITIEKGKPNEPVPDTDTNDK